MKKIKYFLYFFVFCLSGLIIYSIIFGPVVLDFSKNIDNTKNENYKVGQVISPLEKFNFDYGSWTAYLFINRDDSKDLSKEMPRWHSFKTSNIKLLKEMKSEWKFAFTGGDMATVESELILCEDGKTIYQSGIVLDDVNQGLQSEQYGWLEAHPKNLLSEYCRYFHRNFSPIIILR